MAIDPSIILGIRQPQIRNADPMQEFAQAMQLKQAMTAGELKGLQAQEVRRSMADDEAVRDAYRLSAGDNTRLRQLLGERGQFRALQALDKQEQDRLKAQAEIEQKRAQARKYTIDGDINRLIRGAGLFGAVTDQASYQTALRVGQMTGIFTPEEVSQMPTEFNPQIVRSLQSAGMTRAEQLADQRDRERLEETRRSNQERERTARGNLAVNQGNLSLSRERLNFERGNPTRTYDPERGLVINTRDGTAAPVALAGGGALPPVLGSDQKKELTSINQQREVMKGALGAVETTPGAFSFARGTATMAGPITESVAGRFDNDAERQARSYVFNNVSKVINERAGAAQSAQELARLRSFLPAETDNADQVRSKINGFLTYLDDLEKGTRGNRSATPAAPEAARVPPPPKIGDRVDGFIYKGGNPADPKSWERAK